MAEPGTPCAPLDVTSEAVRDLDGNKPWVLVARDGLAIRADVSVGLAGIGRVEILKGLAEGDLVILPASGALDGDKIRIRAPKKPKVGGVQVPQGMTK